MGYLFSLTYFMLQLKFSSLVICCIVLK
jgi:hypothetical protein